MRRKLAVSAPLKSAFLIAVVAATWLHAAASAPAQFFQQHKLTPSDSAAGDLFGWSSAVSGNQVLVGSPRDGFGGPDPGSAYLFDLSTGAELTSLTAPDGVPGDVFGAVVALEGNKALISDYGRANFTGAAYVFDLGTDDPPLVLTASDGEAEDYFGVPVDISGNVAIVGAYFHDEDAVDTGAAYLFDATTGEELRMLMPTDLAAEDFFGIAAAVSGNTAIVGSAYDDDDGENSGSAYLFDVTTGQQLFKLTASDAAAEDYFGEFADVDGNIAIVSTRSKDGIGAAYLFDVTTGNQLHKLTPSDGALDDNFGGSVSISGNLAVIGAYAHDSGGTNAGAAYVFDVTTGQELFKLTADDAAAFADFGFQSVVDGDAIVIGASSFENELAPGAAYVFRATPVEWVSSISANWNSSAGWSNGGVPNSPNVHVLFGDVITSPIDVTLNIDATVSRITFDNSNSYTLADDSIHSLTLAGGAVIDVIGGSHTISAPIAGGRGLIKTGAGALTLTGTNTYSGATRVTAGTLNVRNQAIPGDMIEVAGGATLRFQQFVFYELAPGQVLAGGGNVVLEHSFSNTELYVAPTAEIQGTLTIDTDNVINSGRIAPGFSPGIIVINGDYTQENDGLLEIEVGGLTPGTQHDQLQVTGSASLGGRMEVPIIDGFMPSVNDEITFLTADEVSGTFSGLFSPNLASVDPNLALRVLYGANNVRLQFVAPSTAVQFNAMTATSDWATAGTWTGGLPGTSHVINVSNLAGVAQRVNVESQNAFTHQLSVTGNANTITVAVSGGLSLSATTGMTVNNNAIIELESGVLVGSAVDVTSGGQLLGNGTVVGNLVVGAAAGTQEATLSPGLSMVPIGQLDVQGDYQQGAGGALRIDVQGADEGEFDTIIVSGEVAPGGTLRVDASFFVSAGPGTVYPIIAAGSLTPGAVFANVETIGNENVFFAPIYNTDPGAGAGSSAGGASGGTDNCQVRVCVAEFLEGDMNRNGMYDPDDVQAFALALTKPLSYFQQYFIFGHESGDIDDNGLLDFDDIDEFAELMNGSGASAATVLAAIEHQLAVPEPSAMVLVLWGASAVAAAGGRVGRRNRVARRTP